MEHLHLTTRRCFIGPIPEGWLKSHRKSWYSRYLTLSDYSSRAATFSAKPGISHARQITGLDGPSASAAFSRSFPQPEDVDEEAVESDDDAGNSGNEQNRSDTAGPNELEVPATAVEELEEEPPSPKPKRRATFAERLPKKTKDKPHASTFVTAPTSPKEPLKSKLKPFSSKKNKQVTSFVTAKENLSPPKNNDGATVAQVESTQNEQPSNYDPAESPASPLSVTQTGASTGDGVNIENRTNSMSPLLPRSYTATPSNASPDIKAKDGAQGPAPESGLKPKPTSHGMVRFNVAEEAGEGDTRISAKLSQAKRSRSWRLRYRQGSPHPGGIVKAEKMLVRVDWTMEDVPSDYNENDSYRIGTRTWEKWREFVVVCRESKDGDADFFLQTYKTRVIPSRETGDVKSRSTHEIPLSRKNTHVNLYSSLDKTLVIWMPWKGGKAIYILRTHSAASAVEWYTFIRQSLGWQRTAALQISVPDLSVSLQLENPFEELEASMTAAQTTKSDSAISKTMEAERAVANSIIQRSLKMLDNNPEWSDVLEKWLARDKIGLAWKRYDRLEWVHGVNEQRMYGTLAMQQSHELELRPKVHYPTDVKPKDQDLLDEPAPVEGFLIRLTSQKGHVRKLGKMYFKRLYFTTHNHYLCYCRPSKALPPPPPKLHLSENAKIPTAHEIVDSTPLIYAVNPYPRKDGEIEWLKQGNPAMKAKHDTDAYKEAERKVNSMLEAEGYINLSHVVRVQHVRRGNSVADANVDEGPDVDFHEEVDDTRQDDGKTNQFDETRTFEVVMKNGLVIRLQAYNEVTKKEWIVRLRKLVHYWKLRLANDVEMLKAVRAQNLQRLEIDEETEAYLGQFGSKWEVTRSVASPKLFNVCGIACCRAITVSNSSSPARQR